MSSRYLVFAGDHENASGGAFDLVSGTDDFELATSTAMSKVAGNPGYWAHVFDTETKSIVIEFDLFSRCDHIVEKVNL